MKQMIHERNVPLDNQSRNEFVPNNKTSAMETNIPENEIILEIKESTEATP